MPSDAARVIRGATVVKEALTHADAARFSRPALVNGSVGTIVVPRGRLTIALRCTVKSGKIVEMDVIADPAHLSQLDLAVLND